MHQLAAVDQDAVLLMTIPGVGYCSALLTKSGIGDTVHSPSAKQLCSHTGLVPSTYSSGNVCFHGHITKRGSKWLRCMLVEAAVPAMRRPGPLRRFYHKVERKKGEKVARAATARELLEWTYHVLKDGRTFHQVERIAEPHGRGEPVFCTGSA